VVKTLPSATQSVSSQQPQPENRSDQTCVLHNRSPIRDARRTDIQRSIVRVHPSAPARFLADGLDVAALFQPIQGRVKRALLDLQRLARNLPDALRDGVTVGSRAMALRIGSSSVLCIKSDF
jgi:hypothetical protein